MSTGSFRRRPTPILPHNEASCIQNSFTFGGSGFPLNTTLFLSFLIFLIRVVERQVLCVRIVRIVAILFSSLWGTRVQSWTDGNRLRWPWGSGNCEIITARI